MRERVGFIAAVERNELTFSEICERFEAYDEPREATRRIFDALCAAFYSDPLYDLAFDVGNPTITIHANEVLLGALRSRTYEQYQAEIRGMLTERDDA